MSDLIAPYAKSIVAAFGSGLVYFLTVLAPEATPSDITFVQWIGFALAVLGTGGAVAAVPNKSKSSDNA